MDNKYNPYEDSSIHTTQPDNTLDYSERQGFNDVIKHYDAVNGFQNPKQLNHLPRPLRRFIKWAIIINVSVFVGFLIYQLIESML